MADIRDIREERGDYIVADALEDIARRIRHDDEFNPDAVFLGYMDEGAVGIAGDGSTLAQVALIEVAKAQLMKVSLTEG